MKNQISRRRSAMDREMSLNLNFSNIFTTEKRQLLRSAGTGPGPGKCREQPAGQIIDEDRNAKPISGTGKYLSDGLMRAAVDSDQSGLIIDLHHKQVLEIRRKLKISLYSDHREISLRGGKYRNPKCTKRAKDLCVV